jgi:hypothetical protein
MVTAIRLFHLHSLFLIVFAYPRVEGGSFFPKEFHAVSTVLSVIPARLQSSCSKKCTALS